MNAVEARKEAQKAAEDAQKRAEEATEAVEEAKQAAEEAEEALEDTIAAGAGPDEVRAASARARGARAEVEDAENIRRASQAALTRNRIGLFNARIAAQGEEWAQEDVDGTLDAFVEAGAAFVEAIGAVEDLLERYRSLRRRRAAFIARIADMGGATGPLPSLNDPLAGTELNERTFRELADAVKKLAAAPTTTTEKENAA